MDDTKTPPLKPEPGVTPAPRSGPRDVSEKSAAEIRREIKSLAVDRERLVAANADPKSIADVLKDIAALAAEGTYIERALLVRREAEKKQREQRAEQSERDALAKLEARYEEDKARVVTAADDKKETP